jgi:transcriptional regulator with XRE-family HTH domain
MQEELQDAPPKAEGNQPDRVDRYIGKRLQLRRKLIGMSQEQLGKALGVTFQQIQKYERAANRIAASRLLHMASLMGVSFNWFIEGAPSEAPSRIGFSDNKQAALEDVPVSATNLSEDILDRKETSDLLRAYYSITDSKQRRKIFELIKSIADAAE